jgi:hypothetical protein
MTIVSVRMDGIGVRLSLQRDSLQLGNQMNRTRKRHLLVAMLSMSTKSAESHTETE